MLFGEIAREFPGLGDPRQLRGDSVFMWYLQARASHFRRLEEQRVLSLVTNMTPQEFEAYSRDSLLLASGPGKLVAWEDTLTEKQRAGLRRSEARQARTIERLAARGAKASGTVPGLPPEQNLGARLGPRVVRRKRGGAE